MAPDRVTAGLSASGEWTIPREASGHVLTISRVAPGPQALFLDYLKLEGVQSMEVNYDMGRSPVLTLKLHIKGISYVEGPKD